MVFVLDTCTKQFARLVIPSTVSTVIDGMTQHDLHGSASFLMRPSEQPQHSEVGPHDQLHFGFVA